MAPLTPTIDESFSMNCFAPATYLCLIAGVGLGFEVAADRRILVVEDQPEPFTLDAWGQ